MYNKILSLYALIDTSAYFELKSKMSDYVRIISYQLIHPLIDKLDVLIYRD